MLSYFTSIIQANHCPRAQRPLSIEYLHCITCWVQKLKSFESHNCLLFIIFVVIIGPSQLVKCHGRGSLLPQTQTFQNWLALISSYGTIFLCPLTGVTVMLAYGCLDRKPIWSVRLHRSHEYLDIHHGRSIFSQPCQPSISGLKDPACSLSFASTLWQDAFLNHFLRPLPLCDHHFFCRDAVDQCGV